MTIIVFISKKEIVAFSSKGYFLNELKVIRVLSLRQALCFVFERLMFAGHTSGITSRAKSLTSKDFQ